MEKLYQPSAVCKCGHPLSVHVEVCLVKGCECRNFEAKDGKQPHYTPGKLGLRNFKSEK